MMKNKNDHFNSVPISTLNSLSNDMKDVIRSHFSKGERTTIGEVFEILDEYIFWESDEYANNLFNGLDKKTSVLIDIK